MNTVLAAFIKAETIKKRPTIIRHIPFHLMKPIMPNEFLMCLCKDCQNIPIRHSILHEQEYKNIVMPNRRGSF